MGPIVSYNKTFVFDEHEYNYVIAQSIKINEKINIDILQSQYRCMMINHYEEKVYTICTNMDCQAQSRRVCFFCVRDELHKQDQNHMMSHFRSDYEISKIISAFIIIIQNEIDSLEFDILIQKLEFFDKKNNKKIIGLTKKFKEIYSDLKNYKQQVNNLCQKNYYEKLDVQQNLSLLNFLREQANCFIVLQRKFFNTVYSFKGLNAKVNDDYDIQQNLLGEMSEKWIKKQQILIDLNKSNINFIQINIIIKKLLTIMLSDSQYRNIIQMQVEICKLSKQYEEAIKIIDLNLDRLPKIEFIYLKAQLLEKCNQSDQALLAYDQLINLNPNNSDYLFLKAQLLEKCEQIVEALSIYDEIIEINPHNTYYKFLKAELLKRCKKFDEAVLVLNQIIQLKPENTDYLYEKAKLLEKINKFDEALLIYDKIINLKSDVTFYQQKKAELLERCDKFEESLQICDQIIKSDLNNNTFKIWKAKFLTRTNKFDEALLIYDQMNQLNTNQIIQIEEALLLFDLKIREQSKNFELKYKKAELLKKCNKIDASLLIYDQVIKENPYHSCYKYNKAEFLLRCDKFDEALLIYDEIVQQNPKDNYYKCKKAEFLQKCDKFDQALIIYNEIIQLNPNHIDYKINKADLLEKYNKLDEALQIYDEIIQLNSNNFDSLIKKVEFLIRHNKLEESKEIISQIIVLKSNNKLDELDFQLKFDKIILKWSEQNQFRINNSENLFHENQD